MSDIEEPLVHVVIARDESKKEDKPKPEQYGILKTFQSQLSTVAPPESVLPHSSKRIYAQCNVLGVIPTNSNVYLCDSYANAAPASGNPIGEQLQPGMTGVPIYGTTEVWLVAFGAGAPPFVSFHSIYER